MAKWLHGALLRGRTHSESFAAMLALAVPSLGGWHTIEQEVHLSCGVGMDIGKGDVQAAILVTSSPS